MVNRVTYVYYYINSLMDIGAFRVMNIYTIYLEADRRSQLEEKELSTHPADDLICGDKG